MSKNANAAYHMQDPYKRGHEFVTRELNVKGTSRETIEKLIKNSMIKIQREMDFLQGEKDALAALK